MSLGAQPDLAQSQIQFAASSMIHCHGPIDRRPRFCIAACSDLPAVSYRCRPNLIMIHSLVQLGVKADPDTAGTKIALIRNFRNHDIHSGKKCRGCRPLRSLPKHPFFFFFMVAHLHLLPLVTESEDYYDVYSLRTQTNVKYKETEIRTKMRMFIYFF